MNPDTLRSIRRVTVGTSAIVGLGIALMYYQLPRNDEQVLSRYPDDLKTQMMQKRFVQEQYEVRKRVKEVEGRPT
ncbi:hypothetical protein M408DRAFT_327925 [Serendipita vermifera MAFF 305830]|uniref:Uncharacterized protein n=1 Tax=Serendipita vermifera MAFF 305830 TaxID=933852 RepID=A0A0C2WY57_SERVB|nr:hypothetical protein M408DRAFT_327925 [Serendipita vermifera MAFF 305830]